MNKANVIDNAAMLEIKSFITMSQEVDTTRDSCLRTKGNLRGARWCKIWRWNDHHTNDRGAEREWSLKLKTVLLLVTSEIVYLYNSSGYTEGLRMKRAACALTQIQFRKARGGCASVNLGVELRRPIKATRNLIIPGVS